MMGWNRNFSIRIGHAMAIIGLLCVAFAVWAHVASSRRLAEIHRLEMEVEWLYRGRIVDPIRDNFLSMHKFDESFWRELDKDARSILGRTHPDPDRFLARLRECYTGKQASRSR